jgi:hypothetical protein
VGFTCDGRKVLLHLMAGSKEDAETVSAFFQDMRVRGLGDPLLVVSDGATGIIKAIEVCFPHSTRQRCLAHGMRNLAAKVPEDLWPEFKARATAAYQAPSRKIARELADGIVADYGTELANAAACFMDNFEACIAHLRLPITHRRATRTTNLLERLFVEERRRLKIIPNAFGEKAVLKLMSGAMTRAAERWRSIRITEFERRQMAALRQELDHDYEAAVCLDTGRSRETPADDVGCRACNISCLLLPRELSMTERLLLGFVGGLVLPPPGGRLPAASDLRECREAGLRSCWCSERDARRTGRDPLARGARRSTATPRVARSAPRISLVASHVGCIRSDNEDASPRASLSFCVRSGRRRGGEREGVPWPQQQMPSRRTSASDPSAT